MTNIILIVRSLEEYAVQSTIAEEQIGELKNEYQLC